MIKDFNEWYIDVDITADAEKLTNRWKGIESFIANITRDDICNLTAMYFGIPFDANFKETFAQYFIDIDPTFSVRYDKELALLAGTALVQIADKEYGFDSLVELLIAVNSSFHGPSSSPQILKKISQRFDQDKLNLRKNKISSTNDNGNNLSSFKESINEEWADDDHHKLLDLLIKSQEELFENISIFREDSQILWWMTAQWSNDLNKPFKDIDKNKICLSIGKEAAQFITNYPGPYAMQGVIYNAVKSCKGRETTISLVDLLKSIDLKNKNEYVSSIKGLSFVNLLPLHAAMQQEVNSASAEQWYEKYKKDILLGNNYSAYGPKNYAWQMYLESLAISCYNNL